MHTASGRFAKNQKRLPTPEAGEESKDASKESKDAATNEAKHELSGATFWNRDMLVRSL